MLERPPMWRRRHNKDLHNKDLHNKDPPSRARLQEKRGNRTRDLLTTEDPDHVPMLERTTTEGLTLLVDVHLVDESGQG